MASHNPPAIPSAAPTSAVWELEDGKLLAGLLHSQDAASRVKKELVHRTVVARAEQKLKSGSFSSRCSSSTHSASSCLRCDKSSDALDGEDAVRQAAVDFELASILKRAFESAQKGKRIVHFLESIYHDPHSASKGGSGIMMPMQHQSELFTMRRMIDMFESMGDGELLIAFYAELTDHFMKQEPLSLSSKWHKMGLDFVTQNSCRVDIPEQDSPQAQPLMELPELEYLRSPHDNEEDEEEGGGENLYVSREHDPLGLVQRLFESAANIVTSSPDPVSRTTAISLCIVLAIKSARISLLVRVLQFLVMEDNKNANITLHTQWVGEIMHYIELNRRSAESKKSPCSDTFSALIQQMSKDIPHRSGSSWGPPEGGILLSFGKAEHGRLGHGDTQISRLIPTVIERLKDIKIQKAVSMSSYSIAIDTKGVAYVWGTGGTTASVSYGTRVDSLPVVMESLRVNVPVIDLSCGLGHALFLVEGYKVYSWGNGGNGRLGLGNVQDRFEACPILDLEGVNIVSICCGASHSMAASDSGKLYCWGKNSAGQCAKAGGDDVLTPLLVAQLKDEFVKTIAAGWDHSLALTESGRVYAWGGGYKDSRRGGVPPVLGLGHTEARSSPEKIPTFDSVKIADIASGWDHCMARDSNGAMYTWGSGQNGKLGHGNESNVSVPTLVKALEGVNVTHMSAGCEHSAAIDSSGRLYTWGHGEGGRLGRGDNVSDSLPKEVTVLQHLGLRANYVLCGDKYSLLIGSPVAESKKAIIGPAKQLVDYASDVYELVTKIIPSAYIVSDEEKFPQIEVTCLQMSRILGLALFDAISFRSNFAVSESIAEKPFFLDRPEEDTDDVVFGVEVDKMTFKSFSALLGIVTSSDLYLRFDGPSSPDKDDAKDELLDDVFMTSCLQLLKQNLERFQRKMRRIEFMNGSDMGYENRDADPPALQKLSITGSNLMGSSRGVDLSSEESYEQNDYVDLEHSEHDSDSESDQSLEFVAKQGSQQSGDPLMNTTGSDNTIGSASSQPLSASHQRRSHNNNNVLGSPIERNSVAKDVKEDFSSVLDQLIVATAADPLDQENIVLPTSDETDFDENMHRPSFFRGGNNIEEDRGSVLMHLSELDIGDRTTITSRLDQEAAESRAAPGGTSGYRPRVNSGIEIEGRDPIILARLNSARRSSHPTGVVNDADLDAIADANNAEKRISFGDDVVGSRRETESCRRSNSPAMSQESWENRNSDAFYSPTAQYFRQSEPEKDDVLYSGMAGTDTNYESVLDGLPDKVLSGDNEDSYAMQKALLLSLDAIERDDEGTGEPIVRSGFVRNMKAIRISLHAVALSSFGAMASNKDVSDRHFVLWMSAQESLSAGLSALYTYQDITAVVYGIMKDPLSWFHIIPGAVSGLRVSDLFAAVSKRILSDIIRDLTNKHVKAASPNKKSASKFRSLTSSPDKSAASSSPLQLRMTDLKRALHFGLDQFIRQCDRFWYLCDPSKKYDPEIHVARSYFVLLEMSVSYIIERSTTKMAKDPIEGSVVDQNFLWEGKVLFEVMSLIATIICEELGKLMSLTDKIESQSVNLTSFDWCFTTQVISKFSSFFLHAQDYDVCLVWFPHAVTIVKALVRHIAVLNVTPAEQGTYKSVLWKWMIQQNRWILLYFAMMSTGTEKCKPVKPMMPLRPLYAHAASLISLDAIMSTSSQWMVNMDKIESRKFVLLFCQLPQLFVENDIISDTDFPQVASSANGQVSKDLIKFLYSGAFAAPRRQIIVSGSWVETLVSHLMHVGCGFNVLSTSASTEMETLDHLHDHLTGALRSKLNHVKELILKSNDSILGSLFTHQCMAASLGILGKFEVPDWMYSDCLNLPRMMIFVITYQSTVRLDDNSEDSTSFNEISTKVPSTSIYSAWAISYFLTYLLFYRMMQDQRLSFSNSVPIFVEKCLALLNYIDCLQKMPYLVYIEAFSAPDLTLERLFSELSMVQTGMNILSRHLGLVGQGGSKLWEELSIESYLAARSCNVIGETPRTFFDCNLVALSSAIVGHISLNEIVESLAWSSASSAAFHLSACLLAWITRLVRTVPEMQRYYMDALLIFHRHLMIEPGSEAVESLVASMAGDDYDFDLSKYQYELTTEGDAIDRLDTEVTGQLHSIGSLFEQEAAACKTLPRDEAKGTFAECVKRTLSDLLKHMHFLRFIILQAKERVICSSVAIELPSPEYAADRLKGASKTILSALEQLGNLTTVVDDFVKIYGDDHWSVNKNLFEIVCEGVTSIIDSISEFDIESFDEDSSGDKIRLQIMHLSLRLSSWGSSRSGELYKYFRSSCFLEEQHESDHVILNTSIKSLTSSNINIFNGLQSPDGSFSIRVWIYVSSEFIKNNAPSMNDPSSSSSADSGRTTDAAEFCQFVHVFSRVPESYDVNEVALLKRINSKELRSLPSLYVGLSPHGAAHLVVSAAALLPEMPLKPVNKNPYQSATQTIPDSNRRHVELVSHQLELDKWIQVDVSLAHIGRGDMSSRDLYDLSLVLNSKVDVNAAVVFRGQSLHHNILCGSVPSASNIITSDLSEISGHIATTDLRWIPSAYKTMPLRPLDEANGFLKIPRWYLHRKMANVSEFIVGSTALLSKMCRLVSQSPRPQAVFMDDMTQSAEKLSSLCYVLKVLHDVLVIGNTSAQEYAFDSILQIFAILVRSLANIDRHDQEHVRASAFVGCEMLTSIVGMITGMWEPMLVEEESDLLQQVENETEHVNMYRMPPRLKELWLLRIQNRIKSRSSSKKLSMSESEEFIDGNAFVWKACRIISFAISHSLIELDRFARLPETDPEFSPKLIRFILLTTCGGWINSVGFHSTVDLFTRTLFLKADSMSVDHVAFTSSALAEYSNEKFGIWLKNCTGAVCKKTVMHPLAKNPNHLGPNIFPAQLNTRLPGSEFVTLRDVFYPMDITVFPQVFNSMHHLTKTYLCENLKKAIDGLNVSKTDPAYSIASTAISDLTLAVGETRSLLLQLVRIDAQQLRNANSSAQSVIRTVCKLMPSLLEIADIDYSSFVLSLISNMKLKHPHAELLKNLLKEGDIHLFEKIALRLWPFMRERVKPLTKAATDSSSPDKKGPTAISGELQISDCKIRAVNHFPSVKILDVQLRRMTGRWFYECILMTDGLMQIGWADKSFRCDPSCGHGVGDHPHSWAFDGCRMKKWNVSCENYGQRWKVGDVVGVLLDMDLLEMNFFLNGKNLGTAFSGFPGDSLYPALSINVRQCVRVNYGQYRFVYPPDAIDFFEYRPVIQALTLLAPSPTVKKGDVSSTPLRVDDSEANVGLSISGGSVRNNNIIDNVRTDTGSAVPTSLLSLLENAAGIPAASAQTAGASNSVLNGARNNANDSDSGLTHVSNHLIRALDAAFSGSSTFDRELVEQIVQTEGTRHNQEHQANVSNSTEDSDSSENSDEDGSSGDDEEEDDVQRFRQSMDRDSALGEGRGERNGDVVNQELEFRRQALIENLIAMGFPVDWALRAAEHCESSVSESAAITWIIERMELEQTKLEEFDTNDSRLGTDMDVLVDEATSGFEQSQRISIGGVSRNESSPNRNSQTQSMIADLHNMVLNSGNDSKTMDSHYLASEINNNISFGDSVDSGLNASQNLSASLHNGGDSGSFVAYLPIDDKMGKGYYAWNSDRLYSTVMPGRDTNKFKANIDKQETLLQLSTLESDELFSTVVASEFTLSILYARSIVARFLSIINACAADTFHNPTGERKVSIDFATVITGILSSDQSFLISSMKMMFKGALTPFSQPDKLFPIIFSQNPSLPLLDLFTEYENNIFIGHLNNLEYEVLCANVVSSHIKDRINASLVAQSRLSAIAVDKSTLDSVATIKNLIWNSTNCSLLGRSDCSNNACEFVLSLIDDALRQIDGMLHCRDDYCDWISGEWIREVAVPVSVASSPASSLDVARRIEIKEVFGLWATFVLKSIIDTVTASPYLIKDCSNLSMLWSNQTLIRLLKCSASSNVSVKYLCNVVIKSILSLRLIMIRTTSENVTSVPSESNELNSNFLHRIIVEFMNDSRDHQLFASRLKVELLSNRVYSKYSTGALNSLVAYRTFLQLNKRAQSNVSKLKMQSNQVVKVLGCSRLSNKEGGLGMNHCISKWEEVLDTCSGALLSSSRKAAGEADTLVSNLANRPQFFISGIGSTFVMLSWNVADELQKVRTILQSKLATSGKFHDIKLALVICIGNSNDVISGSEANLKWIYQTSECIGSYRIDGIEPDQKYVVSLTLRWNNIVLSTTDDKTAGAVPGQTGAVGVSSFQLPLQLPGSLASRIMRSVGGAGGANKPTYSSNSPDGASKNEGSDDGSLGPDGKDAKSPSLFGGSLFNDDVMVTEQDISIDDSCFEYPMSYSLSFSTESETQFLLDQYHMASPLILGGNSLSVKNKVNKKWSTIRATVRLSSGVHRWGVHIDRCVSKNIFIGVVAEEARCDNYVGCDRFGYAFLANRAIWHNKSKTKSYGELFATGDMVMVTLNLIKGTLSFSLNGKDLGVAVDGLVGPLYPAFSLYNEDDQISIIPMKSVSSVPRLRSPLDELASKGSEFMHVLTASDPDEFSGSFSSCIDSFMDRIEMTKSFLTYLVFSHRLDGQEFDYKRALLEVPRYLDIERDLCGRWARWMGNGWTRSVCSPFGAHAEVAIFSHIPCFQASSGGAELVLKSGDTIKSNNGLAVVIGVGDHRVWFQLVDNGGIFSATRDDVMSSFMKGQLSIHEVSAPTDSNVGLTNMTSLGRSEFMRLLRCDIFQFPPHLDAHLVEWLEFLARAKDCHPCNLRMCDIISPHDSVEEIELLSKNNRSSKYSHIQYLHKFRPLRHVGLDLLRVRALVIITANDILLSSVVALPRPQNLANFSDARPPLSWDIESLLFRSKSIIFRQVKFDIAARIGGDFCKSESSLPVLADAAKKNISSGGAFDLPVTHDCSPIPFILKNGSYFSKSYNIEKSLQSKGVSLRSSASDLVDTFDLNNRKVVGIDESNPVKPTASRRSSKMGSYPILELEQKSILARELLEKSLSQSMQRQLLCDIRWRMISGYQTSLLGQLFRRFEFIIDSNQNGFDGMFDRLSGLPKAADTGSDALVAGLGFFDTSTRGGMTWEASMRRYMRPGVQWEDWIPPSNRRCPLFIRASMRASSATTIEHHEFRNRTMFQISMWDPEYFYWILEGLRTASSSTSAVRPAVASAPVPGSTSIAVAAAAAGGSADAPAPESIEAGVVSIPQGITPCAISDFNLFEYYLRAAVAEMEGLLQPQMVDAIYEGKSPGEIGILMQMMHAIGVALGLALRLGVQIQTKTIPDMFWAACAGEIGPVGVGHENGPSSLYNAAASAVRHGVISIYPEMALSYWTSSEIRDILSCQSDVSNVCVLRESSELARDDFVIAVMEESNFASTFTPFPEDKVYIEYFWLALAELARSDRIRLLRALYSGEESRKHDHVYCLSFSAPQWVSTEIGREEVPDSRAPSTCGRDRGKILGALNAGDSNMNSSSRGLHVTITILPPVARSTVPAASLSASSDDDLPVTIFPNRSAISIPRYSGVSAALNQLAILVAKL